MLKLANDAKTSKTVGLKVSKQMLKLKIAK